MRKLARARFLLVSLVSVAAAFVASACSSAPTASAPARPVAAASPPKDDGLPAQGGEGGTNHSAALEELRTAKTTLRNDKQNSVLVPLPDAEHWTRVKFMTVPSLVGFRYGKAHHAIVAAFITNVTDNGVPGACAKSFEGWADPWIQAFEVELDHEPPTAFSWSPAAPKKPAGEAVPKTVAIVDVDAVHAKTATILARESYAAAWAAYPAWGGSCLILGVAIPDRDDATRARDVRDRFVREVFPEVKTTGTTEPKERY